jgi:hypothetical protein
MFERILEFVGGAGGTPQDPAKKPQVSRGEFDKAERLQQEAWDHECAAKGGRAFLDAVEEKETRDQEVARLIKLAEDEARRVDEKYQKLKTNGASPEEIHRFEKEKLGMHAEE